MEEVSLHNAGFVPLAEEGAGGESYGGKQAWYRKKGQRLRGCGPVAAANILCYMAGSQEKYRPLYPSGAPAQAHFLVLMEEMYAAVSPAFIGGAFSRKRFARRIIAWARRRGVPLEARFAGPRTHSCEEALEAVCQGLEKDKPVAALNLKLRYPVMPGGENFGWHWVTVTGVKRGPDGRAQLEASSWGRRFSLDWEGYWQACRKALLPGGFVWFE